jgi:hypothetical protein
MPIGIETARKRLHQKLSRKRGKDREFPWYEDSAVRGDRIEVLVTDVDAAEAALQPTYYTFELRVVSSGEAAADDRPAVAAPGPQAETPGPQAETPGPQAETPGPQAPGPQAEAHGPQAG